MKRLTVVAAACVAAACQTATPSVPSAPTMSVDEAKRVTTSFAGAIFVPPPRTIADLTALLPGGPSTAVFYETPFERSAIQERRNPVLLGRQYWMDGQS